MSKVTVIGAGLAGCEAAWQLSNAGISVDLYEMKPKKYSPAHKYQGFAELVCSNSLKASRLDSAAGLLKEEMRILGSIIVPCAYETSVAAGGALAVDRTAFSDLVTEKIKSRNNINIIYDELKEIPEGNVIIATGPLTSDDLADSISEICGSYLSFFDAAAPIITAESLDYDCLFTQSRYDRGGEDDYINCPMNKEEYEAFYEAITTAERAGVHSFDERHDVYEGCMPIEAMASRGA
ncbi:MAG: methylenetetrahydrofolate--tRNA-(uracil(54)-C(5))-methyltransferase (FADH(2)-oxidizing) TrmFO, partial [Oscillospiraceae bacterium]|nr:methylenetetrahydrofolate--tRNA-(uracil(54)-C(5))-methyltransferase (FADH(2)-oxidizing) TrmFO [Oscillospiraceae bacterium]